MVNSIDFDENENPNFIDGCNIEGKQGSYIKGKDVIHLDAPEIYFPQNAPLDTEKRELYDILNELFQSGGEGGEWQPPASWIPVPEPGAYDIYMLVQVLIPNKQISIYLADYQGDAGKGAVTYDWGDGTIDIPPPHGDPPSYVIPTHTYAEAGQYLIHLTGSANAYFLRNWDFDDRKFNRGIAGLIIKTGSEIAFRSDYYDHQNYSYNYNNFFGDRSFKHIKIMHPKGVPAEKRETGYFASCAELQKLELVKKISGELTQYTFQECYALKKINDFIDCENVSKIGKYAFANCYRLEDIDFPNCTEITTDAFSQCYNLIRANLPSCTTIGDYGFSQCYNLQKITTADDCAYGKSCFQNCYSLYPRPDGSTN